MTMWLIAAEAPDSLKILMMMMMMMMMITYNICRGA